MKLSTMFKKAQKELTRTEGCLYQINDGHCALGVILHYKYGHRYCLVAGHGHGTKCYTALRHDRQVLKLTRLLGRRKGGKWAETDEITSRNDCSHWSFARFEKRIRELGL